MSHNKKKLLHILVQLALADEVFSESEKQSVRLIGDSYGLSVSDIDEIIETPDFKESLAPMTVLEKMDFMIDCITVLLADKEIHPSEDRFVRSLASKLGFKDQVVTFLMEYNTMERAPLKDMMTNYMA
ncbi:MAG: putative tellurite resistance protein B-like protein [Cyclobacteriaceae bacterium]|jgi:uncharacterized tellurite resistance protein B-like protein